MKTTQQTIGWSRDQMAQRAALDIPDGAYVNLGIGIPEKVARYVPDGREVIYHTENGLLGMGVAPEYGHEDTELINAGKKPVTAIPGAAYFHHADSFAMIRGQHIDICVLGAMQVSQQGDLANWSTGAKDAIPAVGGAMDLVAGVKTIFVITQHTTKNGEPKLVERCSYPLTGRHVVDRIYTDLAVIDVTPLGLEVVELAPGIDFDYLQQRTNCKLLLGHKLGEQLNKPTVNHTETALLADVESRTEKEKAAAINNTKGTDPAECTFK
ncbi:3-oxoacid CoA-transferase subunit B [Photobacterium obscurum]|uniref:3-oxoacid CoA-transferase subunit B n=1 Tax=Photobacterium obscurum TaxID=2829490 RepID=UPI003899D709